MFTPRWKKEAQLWLKGSKKFLHYKRDLLELDRIDEIESRRDDLKKAIKAKDLDAVKEASKQLHNTCDRSLKHYKQPEWLEENIEVFWVAIVVALGIRAYFLQPFRIPTGSMQPSLNGIIMESADDPNWEKPWFGKRIFDYAFSGKSYTDIVAEEDLNIAHIKDSTWFLFSKSTITFTNGKTISISAPENATRSIPSIAQAYRPTARGLKPRQDRVHFKKGDPIFRGTRTTGDLVLVNKFAYHFRKPKRGESFVFDTLGIQTQKPYPFGAKNSEERYQKSLEHLKDQSGGTHFIKRLAAVPGDTIQIKSPQILLNGEIAKEETFQRVSSLENDYPGYTNTQGPFINSKFSYTLETKEDPNHNQYFALGDNSPNSLDSRSWGPVRQYNLVGPALFALWPFGSGHWGFIK